jgi:uncharacterized protein (DUF1697 family)
MEKYISILRGINVSGSKPIKMDALRALFEDLNFKSVTTYIQSGNVVFADKKTNTRDLEKRIQKEILKVFGFDVPVIVKEKKEVELIIKNNPFIAKKNVDATRLYVTFLSEEPEQIHIDKIKELKYPPDEFIILEKAVYMYVPISYGNTKLNNNFFESKLKVAATTRNWRTVNELVNIAEAI